MRSLVVACGIGAAGCNYPALPELAGDASIDAVGAVDAVDASMNVPPTVLSCQGLARACGPYGNDDCCNSPPVAGGTYYRSYDRASDGTWGNKSFAAMVSNFRLDKYEVTVARFRAFVTAGRGTQERPPGAGDGAHAKIAGSGWDPSWNTSLLVDKTALILKVKCDATFQTWTDSPGLNEARPMNCITWYEAMAFCAWDGGYLPTEAEWNYVASGGGDTQGQRAYPWSNPPEALTPFDNMHASYFDGSDCVGDGASGCAVTDLLRAGSKPMGDGRWGQSDLAGNVWEWNLDWYGAYVTPCNDCALVSGSASRVLRGGSLTNDAPYLRAAYRRDNTPARRLGDIGVRCARTQ